MLRKILDWLQDTGLIFATLLINITTATITAAIILLIHVVRLWWERHT